jgi:hypothetical protein
MLLRRRVSTYGAVDQDEKVRDIVANVENGMAAIEHVDVVKDRCWHLAECEENDEAHDRPRD